MSPDALEITGEALYGWQWQASMSRDIKVGCRTIRRWLDGSHEIPEGVEVELRAALIRKSEMVKRAIEAIETDLVERLREEAKFSDENPYERCDHSVLLKESATEIERLRNRIEALEGDQHD